MFQKWSKNGPKMVQKRVRGGVNPSFGWFLTPISSKLRPNCKKEGINGGGSKTFAFFEKVKKWGVNAIRFSLAKSEKSENHEGVSVDFKIVPKSDKNGSEKGSKNGSEEFEGEKCEKM